MGERNFQEQVQPRPVVVQLTETTFLSVDKVIRWHWVDNQIQIWLMGSKIPMQLPDNGAVLQRRLARVFRIVTFGDDA